MKIPALVTAVVIILWSGAILAECVIPEVPAVADGATSDKESFMAGYQRTKNYLANGDAYIECLVSEEKAEEETGNASDKSQAARRKRTREILWLTLCENALPNCCKRTMTNMV